MVVQFPHLGSFTFQSIRAMIQLYKVKKIRSEVLFEHKCLPVAFEKYPESEKHKVEHALLDGALNSKPFQVMCYGCSINFRDIATLCEERYFPDKIINFMVHLYYERGNKISKTPFFGADVILNAVKIGHGCL